MLSDFGINLEEPRHHRIKPPDNLVVTGVQNSSGEWMEIASVLYFLVPRHSNLEENG